MIQARTYYCGSAGGVRKLVDLTGPWIDVSLPTNGIPESSRLELFDIEVDPNNGDHVVVVGEAHCGLNWFGIAITTNGGVTWQIPGGNYQSFVNNLTCYYKWVEVTVVDSNTIYACGIIDGPTNLGIVVKSTDGGLTFNTCSPLPAAVAGQDCNSIHFTSPLVGVVGMNNYVIKTIDGGNTWTVLNGGSALSTSNPAPNTQLNAGPITGIHITHDESYIIGIGPDFIVESTPVIAPSPLNSAGMLIDSWQKNFVNTPPGVFGNPIGVHLSYLPPSYGNDNFIFITGQAELGIYSATPRTSWVEQPAPGYQTSGLGFSRIAAHFYNLDSSGKVHGFYNEGTNLYHNVDGFNPAGGAISLSDISPYGVNAVWTWYQDTTPSPTCYLLTSCDGLVSIITNSDLSGTIGTGLVYSFVGYSQCFTITISDVCTGAIPMTLSGNSYQSCAQCTSFCYRLIDCSGVKKDIITNSDFSGYLGQVITLGAYPGVCWTVASSQSCVGSVALNTTITSASIDCLSCKQTCYILSACNNIVPDLFISDNLSTYVNKIITLAAYPGICWVVAQAPQCSKGSGPLGTTIVSSFPDCTSCSTKCYALTDCKGKAPVIITNTDLSAYVDKVIKILGCDTVCYLVTASNSCTGSTSITVNTSYATCELCNPSPPKQEIPLKTRRVQPNYGSEHCSIDIIEDVNCRFAAQVYNKVIQKRYGIQTCVEDEFDKYLIKKELLGLNLIYDPTACIIPIPPVVCPPVVVVPPTPIPCSDPTNVVATFSTTPAPSCDISVINNVQITYQTL